MRRALYLSCLCATVTGILLGRYSPPLALIAIISVLAGLTAGMSLVFPGWWKAIVVPGAFMALGAFLMFLAASGARGGILPRLALDKTSATVTGQVVSTPHRAGDCLYFFVEAAAVETGASCWETGERVLVRTVVNGDAGGVFSGVRVEVRGRLRHEQDNPGWLLDKGAASILESPLSGIKVVGGADIVSRLVHQSRNWMTGAYGRLFGERVAGFIEGVTLGRKDNLDPGIMSDLRACGLSHIVAVSGLHVAAVVALVLAAASALGAGRLSRLILACAAAMFVVALAGFRPSALRASVMAGLCFGGMLLGRKNDPLNGLCLAGFLLMFANPRALFDPGFQFSFAATLGIVIAMRSSARKGRTIMLVAVCAGAQLGIIPMMLSRGEGVPVTAIAANLAVVPLVGPLMASAWGACLLSALTPTGGKLLAVVPEALSRLIISIAGLLSKVPGAGVGGALSIAALVLYVSGLVALVVRVRERRSVFGPLVAVTCSVLLAVAPMFIAVAFRSPNSITVLDVGQGDAILIRDRSGAVVLIDGGPDERQVTAKLRSRGVRKIDVMVSSHPHADHITGLVGVIGEFPVGLLIDSGVRAETSACEELLEAARLKGVSHRVAREGQVIEVSPHLRLEVVFEPELSPERENLNNCSVVIMVHLDGAKALLTADLEKEGQLVMLGLHPDLSCDILKVPHQGAWDAALPELVESADPALGVISVGEGNTYGHPSEQHLKMLEERGVRVLRTDLVGDIEISVDSGRIGVAAGGG
ncbi:MAG: ComEC/Rec2 family competence protein [Actinobacteria bacterium]|nr:ComEC/Rec2 family competence protein [Actinomycetota bacterium]